MLSLKYLKNTIKVTVLPFLTFSCLATAACDNGLLSSSSSSSSASTSSSLSIPSTSTFASQHTPAPASSSSLAAVQSRTTHPRLKEAEVTNNTSYPAYFTIYSTLPRTDLTRNCVQIYESMPTFTFDIPPHKKFVVKQPEAINSSLEVTRYYEGTEKVDLKKRPVYFSCRLPNYSPQATIECPPGSGKQQFPLSSLQPAKIKVTDILATSTPMNFGPVLSAEVDIKSLYPALTDHPSTPDLD